MQTFRNADVTYVAKSTVPPTWLFENVSHHLKVLLPAFCMMPEQLKLTWAVSGFSVEFRGDNKVIKHLHHFAVCDFFLFLFFFFKSRLHIKPQIEYSPPTNPPPLSFFFPASG